MMIVPSKIKMSFPSVYERVDLYRGRDYYAKKELTFENDYDPPIETLSKSDLIFSTQSVCYQNKFIILLLLI